MKEEWEKLMKKEIENEWTKGEVNEERRKIDEEKREMKEVRKKEKN